jgi:hypothetical protein
MTIILVAFYLIKCPGERWCFELVSNVSKKIKGCTVGAEG